MNRMVRGKAGALKLRRQMGQLAIDGLGLIMKYQSKHVVIGTAAKIARLIYKDTEFGQLAPPNIKKAGDFPRHRVDHGPKASPGV